jgi:tripartite ATP-independent transporter DctM subunit
MNPDIFGEVVQSYTLRDKLKTSIPIWPAGLIFILVIGGMYAGVITPTEAGALGAASTLLVVTTLSNLRYEGFKKAVIRTAEITTMIFMIIIGAMIFGRYLAFAGVIRDFVTFMESLPLSPMALMILLITIYILMGMMMDQSAILILTLPLTFPLAMTLGFDPIWFGIIIAKTIEIGLVTPPLGLNVYVATGTVDMSPDVGFRGAVRFLIIDVILIVLLLLFPEIVTVWPGIIF